MSERHIFRANVKRSLAEEESEGKVKEIKRRQPVKKTVDEYCNETSVEAITFLNKGHSSEENYFWLLILFLCLLFCIFLIKMQYDRWQRTPLFISMENIPGDVSEIPFPAITICSEPRGIVTKDIFFEKWLNESIRVRTLIPKPDWVNDTMFDVLRTFWQVCGWYHSIKQNMTFANALDYTIEDALNSILPEIEEFMPKCIINGQPVECRSCFEKTYTKDGICFTYNGLNATEIYRNTTFQYRYYLNDKKPIKNKTRSLDWDVFSGYHDHNKFNSYPVRGTGSGYGAGIDIFLTQNENYLDRYCRLPEEGFKITFHSPDEIPEVEASYITIPYNRSYTIAITPHYTHAKKDLETSSAVERRCYFPNERYLRFFNSYSKINCDFECLSNYTLLYCGCTHFTLPRLLNTKVCNEQAIACYEEALRVYIYYEFVNVNATIKRCNCLRACSTLRYTYLAIRFDDPFAPNATEENTYFRRNGIKFKKYKKKKYKKVLLDGQQEAIQTNEILKGRVIIYFQTNNFVKMKQYKYYGFIDFLATCGGLISFFIGFSLICIAEWFYFATVRLTNNFKDV